MSGLTEAKSRKKDDTPIPKNQNGFFPVQSNHETHHTIAVLNETQTLAVALSALPRAVPGLNRLSG